MTKEEILSMAREAGFGNYAYEASSMFERFADLIAAKAAQDEREACEMLCRDVLSGAESQDAEDAAGDCVDAIRARWQ